MRKAMLIGVLALGVLLLGSQETRPGGLPPASGEVHNTGVHMTSTGVVRAAPASTRTRSPQQLLRSVWALLLVLLVAAPTTLAVRKAAVRRPRTRVPWAGSTLRGPPALA